MKIFALVAITFLASACGPDCPKPVEPKPDCPKSPEDPPTGGKTVAPGGFNGIPWASCSLADPSPCTEAKFRASPLGQMTDGTATSPQNFIYSQNNTCQGNFCRANLNSSHQCMNNATLVCTMANTGKTGTTTCVNGAWSGCANLR